MLLHFPSHSNSKASPEAIKQTKATTATQVNLKDVEIILEQTQKILQLPHGYSEKSVDLIEVTNKLQLQLNVCKKVLISFDSIERFFEPFKYQLISLKRVQTLKTELFKASINKSYEDSNLKQCWNEFSKCAKQSSILSAEFRTLNVSAFRIENLLSSCFWSWHIKQPLLRDHEKVIQA